MSVPEKRHTLAHRAAQMGALQRAADLVGQAALATGLGVAERTLRSYLSVERPLPTVALVRAAATLRQSAAAMLEHADRLDQLA